jgi:hypothetical protein
VDYPNPFDGAEVVSTYTDGQAVEDGVLVSLNEKDRVSRAVWEYLVQHAPKGAKPPNRWPVDFMGWFQAAKISKVEALKLIAEYGKDEAQKKLERIIADRKALAMSSALIRTHDKQARRVYDENIGGGIHKLYAVIDGLGTISGLQEDLSGPFKFETLWLMPNENGGITLMFPEDY